MAETAGLVVGIVALAGLFNNAVECFDFVQLGRSFGKDFQTSQLKLDNARLRLSRWGKSLRLDDKIEHTASLHRYFDSESTIKHAEALLGQIIELFADAEGVSNKYKSRTNGSSATFDSQCDLDPGLTTLHQKMRQLALNRQNRAGMRQKARWALYQEKHFRRLIEDITELVNDLEKLFPATQQIQRELADAEVLTIGDGASIAILKEIAAEQDTMLEQAIIKAAEHAGGTTYNIAFSGSGNTGLQVGHSTGTIMFGRGA
jgi:hypothetical protein